MIKKIIIVSRLIHPAHSPRALRTTNLAIELAKRDYDVEVYCLKGDYDYTEFESAHNVKVSNLGKSILGNGNSDTGVKRKNIIIRVIRRLGGKYFLFPEVEIVYLIWKNRHRIADADCVISIAAPFVIHFGIGCLNIKNKTWISDCGDPFTGNPHHRHPFYFRWLERSWSKKTTYITVPIESAIEAYPFSSREKVHVIPQGFEVIHNLDKNYVRNKIVTFCFVGTFYKGLRDPTEFIRFLSVLDKEFKFIVYTKTDSFFQPFKAQLGNKLELRQYIPREALLVELSKMDFLINIQNESKVQSPSKLIDYYMAKRPILHITRQFSSMERDAFLCYLKRDFVLPDVDVSEFDIRRVGDAFQKLIDK